MKKSIKRAVSMVLASTVFALSASYVALAADGPTSEPTPHIRLDCPNSPDGLHSVKEEGPDYIMHPGYAGGLYPYGILYTCRYCDWWEFEDMVP